MMELVERTAGGVTRNVARLAVGGGLLVLLGLAGVIGGGLGLFAAMFLATLGGGTVGLLVAVAKMLRDGNMPGSQFMLWWGAFALAPPLLVLLVWNVVQVWQVVTWTWGTLMGWLV